MNTELSNRRKQVKPLLVAVCVGVWVLFMMYAFRTLPSEDTTADRLKEMRADVDNAHVDNGWVTKSTNESKYGSALLYRVINGSTIDGDKKARVRRRLLESGWRPLEGSSENSVSTGCS